MFLGLPYLCVFMNFPHILAGRTDDASRSDGDRSIHLSPSVYGSALRHSVPDDEGREGWSGREDICFAHCAKHESNWFRGDEKKSVTYTLAHDAMGDPPTRPHLQLGNIAAAGRKRMMMTTTMTAASLCFVCDLFPPTCHSQQ